MEVIKLKDASPGKNSEVCKTLEYSFNDNDIDLGVATITGRFPSSGYAYNEISRELIYVLEGKGTLNFKDCCVEFSKGDAILIMPNDRYYFVSSYALISMSCTPAWSHEQHKMEE